MTSPAQRSNYGEPTYQGRILISRLLQESAAQGCETEALVTQVCEATGLLPRSVKGVLMRDKRDGLIFGKGAYLKDRGQSYRYFATESLAAEYVFEGGRTEAERKAHKIAMAKQRLLAKTPQELAVWREKRNERIRRGVWAKRGLTEAPPKRATESRAALTPEEVKQIRREKNRERYREKKAASGFPMGTRTPNGQGVKARKAAARLAAGLPGVSQVTVRVEVPAPVSVTKRPVLTGEPIITSATRVTVAPVPRDYRFWVDPATVRPVFGAMRLGVLLEGELV